MEKQNYTEWKLAEAKRIRHKGKQTERDLRLAQSKLDKESNKDKKPEDWLSPRLKELRAKRKARIKELKAKKLVKQKEARLRLEKPKRPLKFLQFYVGRDKNRKQHVGGCKGKNKVSDCRAYFRKSIKKETFFLLLIKQQRNIYGIPYSSKMGRAAAKCKSV